jgi:hypothetical protein
MDIIVPKTEFKNAISLARKALSTVVIQEERGHLLFIVRGTKMIVQGTNNDLKSRCTIDINNSTDEDFSFTADPKVLEKLVSKSEINDLHINFDSVSLTVRVYTTDTNKSFGTLQSFPPDKMLTFGEQLKTDRKEYYVNKEVLLFSLKYALFFLADKKEDKKSFDFVVISKGIVYATNGANKIGLIVFQTFGSIQEMKIRKLVLPLYMNFINGLEGKEVKLIETDKDIGVESVDGAYYFSFLKSTLESTKIPVDYLKSEGAYVSIDKNRLIKICERAIITNNSQTMVGLDLTLSGSGESSSLEVKLVSTKEAIETINCERVNDSDEDICHTVDFRLFKAVLGSFTTKEDIRLHICDKNKFFKVYCKGVVDDEKFILAGVGTYAKIVNN